MKVPPHTPGSRARRIVAALLAPLLVACGGGNGETILIGVAGPLDLVYGRSMKQAADMVVAEVNAAGGIDGRLIELVVRNDRADPTEAISIATDFVENPRVVAVVGHITSGATLAAAGVYNDPAGGLLEISPTASSPEVSNAGPWTFRVCPSDLEHGPALASWLRGRLGGDRAAILYANDAYGRGLLGSFQAAYVGAGGTLIARDPFLPVYTQEEGDLDPYLERAIGRDMDGLVIAGLGDEALHIIRAVRRLGYQGPIMGADGLLGIEEAGAITDGIFVSAPFLPDLAGATTEEFVSAYTRRYGEEPDAYAALTYDALRLVVDAIRSEGTGRAAIRDYVASVGTSRPAYEGVTGTIRFDVNGDVEGKTVVIGEIRDGRVVTAAAGT